VKLDDIDDWTRNKKIDKKKKTLRGGAGRGQDKITEDL
jgi:hypothetical protein